MMSETELRPRDRDELIVLLGDAGRERRRLTLIDLTALDEILAYEPDDMTIRVETGIALAEVQSKLAEHRQWLPIDPIAINSLTIGDIVNYDLSGPRRYGHGTLRDHVIGITIILADGRLVRSGGSVVKNVAGFDLMRLFVGARGCLGIVVDVTFRLRPLPDAEIFLMQHVHDLAEAEIILEQISRAPIGPVILDMYNLDTKEHAIVLGFAGSSEDVAYQRGHAEQLGFMTECDLSYEKTFRETTPTEKIQFRSLLPSRLCETIATLDSVAYVARAGNGIIMYRGTKTSPIENSESPLMRRTRELFDPHSLLPNANQWRIE